MKTSSRIYLGLAIPFLVVGIVQSVRWSMLGLPMTACLWFLLPAAPFLISCIASEKIDRKAVHFLAVPLCLLSFLWAGLVIVAIVFIASITAKVTDVQRYDEVLDEHWSSSFDKGLVKHFPRPIPSNAEDVRFSFQPGFLQAPAHIELRYSTSPEVLSELYDRFSTKKKKMKSSIGENELSDDREVMSFSDDHGSNHGQAHGVTISKRRSEIVYWAERW